MADIQTQLPVKVTDGSLTVAITAGSALKVDGSSVTQPVSGTVTVSPSGTQTVAGTVTSVPSGTQTITGTVSTNTERASNSTFTGTPSGQFIVGVRNDSATTTLISSNLSYGPIALDSQGRVFTVASGTTSVVGGGTSQADKSGFTEGSSAFTPIGGVYNETISSDPTEDQAATLRITAKRAVHVNLRNASGTEIGVSGAPVVISGTITPSGTQTVAGTVTSVPSGTQTVAGTITTTGTVTSVPSGTQTVAGTVTSVPSGTQTVTDVADRAVATTFTGTPTGQFILAVRNDNAATTLNSANTSYGAIAVDSQGRVFVSGSLTSVPSGTQTVAGTVTSVPSGTQTVAGTVTTTGTITSVPSGTQTIAGTVTSVPSGTQTVAGTVTSVPSGTQTVAFTVSSEKVHASTFTGTPTGQYILAVRNDSAATTLNTANTSYGAIAVDSQGRVFVSGSLTSVPSGTQTVAGTVTSVPSGTQTVAGTVTGVPSGTQPVSGTVTSVPSGTQTVAGTVTTTGSITSVPSGTQTVAGTVTSVPSGTQVVTGSGSAGTAATGVVTVQGINNMTPVWVQQSPPSGANNTFTATGSLVISNTFGANGASVSIQTPATSFTSATFVFEASDDSGTTWYPVIGSRLNDLTAESTFTINAVSTLRLYNVYWSGANQFRVRISAISTTNAVSIRITPEPAASTRVFAGSGVAGTPSGGVLSVQGVAGGTALPISGSITATPSGTQTVAGTVTSVPSGTQPVSGTVTSVPSGTQTVAGTVTTTGSITSVPSGTQTVAGTVTSVPSGTQTVAGTVTSVPSGTQTVAGTVTSVPSGTQTVAFTVSSEKVHASTFTGTPTGQYILAVRNDNATATLNTANTSYGAIAVDSQGRVFVSGSLTSVPSGTQTVAGTVTSVPSGTQTVAGTVTSVPSGTQTVAGSITSVPSGTQTVVVSGTVTTTETTTKSEDAPHVSGDAGEFMLAVRNDSAATTFTSANGDYSPIAVDSQGRVFVSGSLTSVPSGTQTVAGTVTSVPSGTQTVAGTVTGVPSGTQTVAGTVTTTGSITSVPSGTQTVAGTVTSVPSGTQTVTGTLSSVVSEVTTGIINNYATVANVATASTGTISYTVTSGKTLYLKQVIASSSGAPCKVVVDYGAGPTVLAVGFYAASSPFLTIPFAQPVAITAGTVVNIKVRNDCGSTQDIYGVLQGREI